MYIDENVKIINDTFKILALDFSKPTRNQESDNEIVICRHDSLARVFRDSASLATDLSFMSISLIISFNQLLFISYRKCRNWKKRPCEFCPIFIDLCVLGMQNSAKIFRMKSY